MWGAVTYLLPVARAIWARRRAQAELRHKLQEDQRVLDGILRDIGRVAREERVDAPGIVEDMRRVQLEEDRRQEAQKTLERLVKDREKEAERYSAEQRELREEIVYLGNFDN